MRFDSKRILVTGASRGIGRALTQQLLAQGAPVLALGRDAPALESLPAGAKPVICDLSNAAEIAALCERLQADGLDGLINNAAIQQEMDFATGTADPARIRQEIATNLSAPLLLAAGLLPVLGQGRGGFLVNVTSGLALAPKRQAPVYCASKAALRNVTRTLRYQAQDAGLPVLVSDCVMALTETAMTCGRGRGKITPMVAAAALLDGVKRDQPEIWVGQMQLLRILYRFSPVLVARILRNG
jgi:uncharacterized oxidoreductase